MKEYPSCVIDKDCHPVPIIQGVDARYCLTVTINEQYKNVLTYIMMNPSKADMEQSDATVNKVICFAASTANDEYKIGKVQILNLFALYEPKSRSLQKLLDQVMEYPIKYQGNYMENRKNINDVISNSKYIVLAWGDVPRECQQKLITRKLNIFTIVS